MHRPSNCILCIWFWSD